MAAEAAMAEEVPEPTTTEMEIEEPISDPTRSDSESNDQSKKQRIDEKSAEEERVENSGRVGLGPKSFGSSVEMFDYFLNMIHHWPPYLNLNRYEHMVVLDLLNKGHPEPEKKIGKGVQSFQIRVHPEWKSKCFFIIRNDESAEDFSFRKCVNQILPLPENMQLGGRDSGHRGRSRPGGRRRGGHGGRGRGRKPIN